MDNGVEDIENNEDSLVNRHKKEKKELQAKIQSLKKSASKGDKKKRKEVLEEISKLEIELEKKHSQELNDLNNLIENNKKNDLDKINDKASPSASKEQPEQHGRISKAQKRRDRKAKEEMERQAEILAQLELNKSSPRNIEIQTIKELLKKRGLTLHPISSDGNCLYNAIKHQLEFTNRPIYDVTYLRNETANYILKNKESLISYMTNNETGGLLTDEDYEKYCENIRKTPAWGGQIEIKALSTVLQVPIEVIQATGPSTIQDENEYNEPPLVITYHRHMFSLGEHYNSTRELTSDDENEEENIEFQ